MNVHHIGAQRSSVVKRQRPCWQAARRRRRVRSAPEAMTRCVIRSDKMQSDTWMSSAQRKSSTPCKEVYSEYEFCVQPDINCSSTCQCKLSLYIRFFRLLVYALRTFTESAFRVDSVEAIGAPWTRTRGAGGATSPAIDAASSSAFACSSAKRASSTNLAI